MAALSQLCPRAGSQLLLSSALLPLNSHALLFPKFHRIYSFGNLWQAGPRPENSPPALPSASGRMAIHKPAALSRISRGVWKLPLWLQKEHATLYFFTVQENN